MSDWSGIYALEKPTDIGPLCEIDAAFIVENVPIYFRCTDAAYWEVYSKEVAALRLIKESFPFSQNL